MPSFWEGYVPTYQQCPLSLDVCGWRLACLVSRMGLSPRKELNLSHPGLISCLLVPSYFPVNPPGLLTRWKLWLSWTPMTGWAASSGPSQWPLSALLSWEKSVYFPCCVGAIAQSTWQTLPHSTDLCNKKSNLGIQISLRGMVITRCLWGRVR